MKKILSVYVVAYLILLSTILGMLYVYPKLELHLMLNSHHTEVQDTFFQYFSILAEGPLYVLALLPMLWKKFRLPLFFALCELSAGTILQVLKHIISHPRPVSAFEEYSDAVLPVVQGVDLHHSNSFPSGHASTFFVFCTCCVLLLAYRYGQRVRQNSQESCILPCVLALLLLAFAVLGAFSRIYLSQHFLSDVCVGSIIGVVTPLLMFYFFGQKILKLGAESHHVPQTE
jgi:membrane-associated phospholipid phosphatase